MLDWKNSVIYIFVIFVFGLFCKMIGSVLSDNIRVDNSYRLNLILNVTLVFTMIFIVFEKAIFKI